MVHGGIISAVIDASMAQCLMGHGIVGYTSDLSIRYRKPLMINNAAALRTSITQINVGVLYTMSCEITQNHQRAVSSTGKFFKVR
jgi:acyl-coenzyme A thioesterase PaaI-like protein